MEGQSRVQQRALGTLRRKGQAVAEDGQRVQRERGFRKAVCGRRKGNCVSLLRSRYVGTLEEQVSSGRERLSSVA